MLVICIPIDDFLISLPAFFVALISCIEEVISSSRFWKSCIIVNKKVKEIKPLFFKELLPSR
tara:strand:- start:41 stop:226 length:186 start_codon:yes stop_codon:yes gene_type:complete